MTVSVLIPAYNEETKIAATVAAAWSLPEVKQVIVVDDGSQDCTAENAGKVGGEVIVLEKNYGKGHALNQGAKYVKGDVILLLDADLGDTAVEASKLLTPVIQEKADLALAVFPNDGSGGLGLVKGLAGWGVRCFGGLNLAAPLSGQRAMNRRAWNELQPFAAGYGVEVSSCITCGRKRLKIVEVEVNMRHNKTNRDLRGFYHRGRQFCQIASVLASEAWKARGRFF